MIITCNFICQTGIKNTPKELHLPSVIIQVKAFLMKEIENQYKDHPQLQQVLHKLPSTLQVDLRVNLNLTLPQIVFRAILAELVPTFSNTSEDLVLPCSVDCTGYSLVSKKGRKNNE